jgi:hypothetical protein
LVNLAVKNYLKNALLIQNLHSLKARDDPS